MSRIQFLAGAMMGYFSICHHNHIGKMAHSASYPMGNRGSYPEGKKQPIHEADHSPPSCAKVKNVCSYNSTLQCVCVVLSYLASHSQPFELQSFIFTPTSYSF